MESSHCSQIRAPRRGDPLAATPSAKASYYLGVLREFDVLAGQQNIPANYALFFRQLHVNLETAFRAAQDSFDAPAAAKDNSECEIELEWLCHQCEYWLGPFGQADLDAVCRKCGVFKPVSSPMTAGEYMAVRLLLHTTTFLVRAKYNRRAWLPHPIAIGRWGWARLIDTLRRVRFAWNVQTGIFKKRLRSLLPHRPLKRLTVQRIIGNKS
jgi:hypothetical protein